MEYKKHYPVVTGVSLTELEKNIVLEESQKRGLYNFSATLRMIINEWKELTAPTPPENVNSQDQQS